jgi:hypothetical protein
MLMGALIAASAVEAQLTLAGSRLLQQGVDGLPGGSEIIDRFGSVLVAGDFDGDGRRDLAIAAPTETILPAAPSAGQVTVVYGAGDGLEPASGETWSLDSTDFGPGDDDDLFGSALAAGDFDDDGFDDLAIGVPFRDVPAGGGGTAADAGAVVVLHGGPGGLSLAGHQFWRQGADGIEGVAEAGDGFGAALAAGDFDGDGFDDLAVGTRGEDVGAIADSGAVNVIYGSPSGLSAAFASIADQIWVQGDLGLSIEEIGDYFGARLAVGDFDADGRDDLAIGAPFEGVGAVADAGAVSVIYGSALGLAASGARFLTENLAAPADAEEFDYFGEALVTADFDGDGYDDLAIGTPGEDLDAGGPVHDAGTVSIVRGSSGGLPAAIAWTLDRGDADGITQPGDGFGSELAAGRFDGGSAADLVVGASGVAVAGEEEAGVAYVFAGRPEGAPLFELELSQAGVVPDVPEAFDVFAFALAAGDFDGDGFDDLAAGAPNEVVGGVEDAGVVHVFVSEGLFRDGFESGDTARWSDAVAN